MKKVAILLVMTIVSSMFSVYSANADYMSMTDKEIWEEIYEIRADMSEDMENKVDMTLEKYDDMRVNYSESEQMRADDRLMRAIGRYIERYEDNMMIVDMLMLLRYEIKVGNTANLDVVDIALNSGMHETLIGAILEAGLNETLTMDGPYTVFAPTDEAFKKPGRELVTVIDGDEVTKNELASVLTYHVVEGAYYAEDITDGLMLETVNGEDIMFTIENGMVMINGTAMVTMTNLMSSNGIVHVIDDVLMPGN